MAEEALHAQARHFRRDRFEIITPSVPQDQTAEHTTCLGECRRLPASLHLPPSRADLISIQGTAIGTQDLLAERRSIHPAQTVEPATLFATQLTACMNHPMTLVIDIPDHPTGLVCSIAMRDLREEKSTRDMIQELDTKIEGTWSANPDPSVRHDLKENHVPTGNRGMKESRRDHRKETMVATLSDPTLNDLIDQNGTMVDLRWNHLIGDVMTDSPAVVMDQLRAEMQPLRPQHQTLPLTLLAQL